MANPTTYEITIQNESGSSHAYCLFAETPQVSNSSSVYQNIWMAAPSIVSRTDGSSQMRFTINIQYYAICGTSDQPLGSNVAIATSDYEKIQLGTEDQQGTTLNFTTIGGANFVEPLPTPTGPNGGFTIQADRSWSEPDSNNTFIGLGAQDMHGNVVPVATVPAFPGITYNMFPVVKFYVSYGTFVEGQILDVEELGPQLEVDFTEAAYDAVTFIHNNQDEYQQVAPSEARKVKLQSLAARKAAFLGESEAPAVGKVRGQNHTLNGLMKEDRLAKELQRTLTKMVRSANCVA
ncbi:uncharacterized protein N7498_009115 [Penicillium cinerascens]|uniref:Uncharacterized protein n=1 Tax=Penicillium cinerascens TaxID=70096 RepID=A0A9W9J4B0_9EURO|nr:uncharacterized protein N7498_009115 [Penicillium cinerascens]KAJ5190130.1 hypothetical protein N7498_009115 [Penicillium cinerascens]